MIRKIIERFIIFSFVIMIVYLGFIIIKQEMYLSQVKDQTIIAEERLNKAKQINEELTTEKNKLNTTEYIEKVAREELGMTKPGEVPYISEEKE
ncbi:septum formation initiator family protein [uncultured Megamonas sp.]|uniref:FtsB family cell division protein n=2 Tax=uncultured Megamonas sp. TaxID=286140 RepID=UPI0025E17D6D|nr:septum formation initiator family protein [uncultured Megamonas sp.]